MSTQNTLPQRAEEAFLLSRRRRKRHGEEFGRWKDWWSMDLSKVDSHP